jgi:hypothetical protein
MATLYFSNTVDYDWATLGNWWTNAAFTTPASALPASSDSVVLGGGVSGNSGSEPTVVNLTQNSDYLSIAVTVTGMATFNGSSYNNGIVTGDATFNDYSRNDNYVSGDATFNDSSYNFYNFNEGWLAAAAVYGGATFNDSSHNAAGDVHGSATFNDSSYNASNVHGDATFNGSSYNGYSGNVYGDATFSGTAANRKGISGTVILAYEKGINGSSILGVI